MWKSDNDPEYPIKIKKHPETINGNARTIRPGTRREVEEGSRTNQTKKIFMKDGAKHPLTLNKQGQ